MKSPETVKINRSKEPNAKVINPYTGDLINLQAFFDFMHDICDDRPDELYKIFDDTIRYITCNTKPSDNASKQSPQSIIETLFKLRNYSYRLCTMQNAN